MSWERAARLVWIGPPLTAAFAVAYFVIADYPENGAEGVEVLFSLTFVTYAALGSLIASRHPRNPVGWLFCFVGLFFSGSEVLYAYARDPAEPAGAGGRGVGTGVGGRARRRGRGAARAALPEWAL